MTERHTRAQIVATIGPASWSPDRIRDMLESGMDAIRLNFSWGTYDEHAHYINTVRTVAAELGRQIPVIQDLSGPREQGPDGHQFDDDKNILTEKDLRDLEFGIAQKVDYVAMSYVGSAADIKRLRSEMQTRGAAIRIIAKIERKIAVERLDEIIAESDAIMVARGDLGHEIPLEEIPFVEKEIVTKSKAAGKPVITATNMLISMCDHSTPARAEITDIIYAIQCGSDAVMLSEETALGTFPVNAVEYMDRAIAAAETHTPNTTPLHPLTVV